MAKKSKSSLACQVFGHKWQLISRQAHGPARGIRTCERCLETETYIYDFSKYEYVWAKGNYMPPGGNIWIVANTYSCYQDRAAELHSEYPDRGIYWLEGERELQIMKGFTHWPDIRFAADWTEASVLAALETYFLCGYV